MRQEKRDAVYMLPTSLAIRRPGATLASKSSRDADKQASSTRRFISALPTQHILPISITRISITHARPTWGEHAFRAFNNSDEDL